MATDVQIQLRKKDFNSETDSGNGVIVFDNITNKIYVGGICYSSDVKNATYDASGKILDITKNNGTVMTLNFNDAPSSEQANSLLASLRDDINVNTSMLSTLNGSGAGSVGSKIDEKIGTLSSDVTIATNVDGVVTLKTNITESDGVIGSNDTDVISLAKIASTGNASDITVTYNETQSNMQTAITELSSRLTNLSNGQTEYIIPSNNGTTPSGFVHYYNNNSSYNGTLVASASTMNKVYMCSTESLGSYNKIITVLNTSTNTYSWIDLGAESIDLGGYVKTVTVNGKPYATTTDGTDVSIGEVVTSVNGENALSTGNSDYVSVVATTSTASDGVKSVALSSKLKTQEVSTANENSDGVALASNVRGYVESNLTTIRTWSDNDIVNT